MEQESGASEQQGGCTGRSAEWMRRVENQAYRGAGGPTLRISNFIVSIMQGILGGKKGGATALQTGNSEFITVAFTFRSYNPSQFPWI